jgi:hypothetical protein
MKLISSALLALTSKIYAQDTAVAGNEVSGFNNGDIYSGTPEGELAMIEFFCSSCQGAEACENACQMLKEDFYTKCPGGICPRSVGNTVGEIDPETDVQPIISARKLKQLKVLILWLQPEHRFARYCFYGCWCLPDNDHKLFTVGYGKPVDNVDASCKRQSQCYDCAQIDHEDRVCDANIMSYSFKLHYDPADPTNHMKKSIECLDQPGKGSKGSCRRSICECDKKLSEDLRTYFHEWTMDNHQEQGTFDSATACVVEGCKNGNCGGNNIECCGNLGSGIRMPYKTDGRRKCCGDKTYDSTFQECCEDNSLAAIGTC